MLPRLQLTCVLLAGLCACRASRPTERPSPQVNEHFQGDSPWLTVTPEPEGEQGEEEAAPGQRQPVARLEVVAPPTLEFILRANLPLPRGTWPAGEPAPVFFIEGPSSEHPARRVQLEPVVRDADGDVRVVEVLARVLRPGQVRPGTRIRYALYRASESDEESAAADEPAERPTLPQLTAQLLDPRRSDRPLLRSHDVYGNLYHFDLNGMPGGAGIVTSAVLKTGHVLRTVRHCGGLVPVKSDSSAGEPMPHLTGVHAYVTEMAGEERIVIDLRVHNGLIDLEPGLGMGDQRLGPVYMRSVELVLPKTWRAMPLAPDIIFDPGYEEDEHWIVPIIRMSDGGSLHMIGARGQLHRRLVIAPRQDSALKREHPLIEGLGFPVTGKSLWSWSHPDCAGYLPQGIKLPHWDRFARFGHPGIPGLRDLLGREYGDLLSIIDGKVAKPQGTLEDFMGWLLPSSSGQGANTRPPGLFLGQRIIGCASAKGYALIALHHRLNTIWHPLAAWDLAGSPTGFHAFLDDGGELLQLEQYGSFGPTFPRRRPDDVDVSISSRHSTEVRKRGLHPITKGRQSSEGSGALSWAPFSGSEMPRYTLPPQALVWIGNDALAKDDLLLTAELFRMAFHGVDTMGNRPGGLKRASLAVAEQPHRGCKLGAGEAWGIDTMSAAYAIADDGWRARHADWFERVLQLCVDAAYPCGAIALRDEGKNSAGTRYVYGDTAQGLLLVHALRAMSECVFRNHNQAALESAEELARKFCEYIFLGPVWKPAKPDPNAPPSIAPRQGARETFALGGRDPARLPFSDEDWFGPNYLPDDGLAEEFEREFIWSGLEYAARMYERERPATAEADEEQGGAAGKSFNPYLARAALCADGPRRRLLELLFQDTAKSGSDHSSFWVGLAGLVEELQTRD